MTLSEIETHLDTGHAKARLPNGKTWSVRRNGKTQTWKTRPDHFRIPIKIGFNLYGSIDHTTTVAYYPDLNAELILTWGPSAPGQPMKSAPQRADCTD